MSDERCLDHPDFAETIIPWCAIHGAHILPVVAKTEVSLTRGTDWTGEPILHIQGLEYRCVMQGAMVTFGMDNCTRQDWYFSTQEQRLALERELENG